MTDFELATLVVLAVVLLGVGVYSYWQIYRAQKRQEARDELMRYEQEKLEAHNKSRYPAYVEEQEPLPETWQEEQAQSDDLEAFEGEDEWIESQWDEADMPHEVADGHEPSVNQSLEHHHKEHFQNSMEAQMVALPEDDHVEQVETVQTIETTDVTEVTDTDDVAEVPEVAEAAKVVEIVEMVEMAPAENFADAVQSEAENETAHEWQNDVREEESSAQDVAHIEENIAAMVTATAVAETPAPVLPISQPSPSVSEISAQHLSSETISAQTMQCDVSPADEVAQIKQRVTQQESQRRAAWDVFAPLIRFESWLHTAYPQGVDPIRAIDVEIQININQPKTAADIERALYDLNLDSALPMRLYGARAGQIHLDSNIERNWQELESGAPYCALKLTLQLANRRYCAQEELLQQWFAMAETLRKRLSGNIDSLPDIHALADYARFLHALARRVGQPIILHLHKESGLWPAYEIHQVLTSCGALLNDQGIYVARNERNKPVYTVFNDVNNSRAQDFSRDQMAVMHVHTLSFCIELARIELNTVHADELEPIQRLLNDMSYVAEALDAQWLNNLGDEISAPELEMIAYERTRVFAEQLDELGLPVGTLMTKRLLLG